MKKALIIAAHPDDEILGCGGTIIDALKHYPGSDNCMWLAKADMQGNS